MKKTIISLAILSLVLLSGCMVSFGYERCETAYKATLVSTDGVECDYWRSSKVCDCKSYKCNGEVCEVDDYNSFTLKENLNTQ